MQNPEEKGESGFTLSAVTITILLSVFLALISTYIALKISALPWPIVFSVVVSMAILKIIKREKATIHEVNVAQAGGTIGGLIAAGIVFVIPAIIFLNQMGHNLPIPSLIELVTISVLGGLLGIVLSMPIRRVLIDEENLPYPSGLAGAEVIKAGDEKGIKGLVLLNAALIATIYALLSSLQLPPILKTSIIVGGLIFSFSIYPMMLAFGSGYILGLTGAVISWVLGALFGWAIILPLITAANPYGFTGSIDSIYSQYIGLVQEFGIGLVLGSGFAFLVFYALPGAKKVFEPFMKISGDEPWYMKLQIPVTVISIIALSAIGLHPINAIIAVVGAWFMAIVAGKMTGETNIDPLEQFGLFVGLLALVFSTSIGLANSLYESILVTSFVAIAAAVAGDIGHDFKGAQVLNTKPIDIVKADLTAVIFGGVTAPLAFMFMYNLNKNNFFEVFTAVQSRVVAGALSGLKFPMVFLIGFLLGVLIELLNRLSIMWKGKPTLLNGMTLGIGFFLGWLLAIPFFVGAVIRSIVEKKKPDYKELGIIGAAGIMAGEGFIFYLTPLFTLYGVSVYQFTLGTVLLSMWLIYFSALKHRIERNTSIIIAVVIVAFGYLVWILSNIAFFTFYIFALIIALLLYIAFSRTKE